jgi:hypothetical protein
MHSPSGMRNMRVESVSHHHRRATATAPSADASRTSRPGIVPRSDNASLLPGLVAPRMSSMPE